MIQDILSAMGMAEPVSITQFQSDEDGESYRVWRLDYPDKSMVLKQAKEREADIYSTFLATPCTFAPRLYATTESDGRQYLLMEYIPGHDLKKAGKEDLTLALNALIAMQKAHWMSCDISNSFEKYLEGRKNRRNYLPDDRLKRAYDAYLARFVTMPRTLCHEDLLPFNVIISRDRAVLIDWEVAGMLPYPTSLARLIAHGEENETAFFYLKEADKAFAIDYFYTQFAQQMGISRAEFDRDLTLCLFYELCEWVYVGNKYQDTDQPRYRRYLEKSKAVAAQLGF